MGLIRKSLFLGTGGLVSPNSKKQRLQIKQLAALQGATPEEVSRAGGRRDTDGFMGLPPASVRQRSQQSVTSTASEPCPSCGAPVRKIKGRIWDQQGYEHRCPQDSSARVTIQMACGHTALIDDPRVANWLGAEAEVSYRCQVCNIEQLVVAASDGSMPAPVATQENRAPAAPGNLTGELERLAGLHSSGVLTDTEFEAAKARLLGM